MTQPDLTLNPKGIASEDLKSVFRSTQNETLQMAILGVVVLGALFLFSALWAETPLSNFLLGILVLLLARAIPLVNRRSFIAASILLIFTYLAAVIGLAWLGMVNGGLILLILPTGLATMTLGLWGGGLTALISSAMLMSQLPFLPPFNPEIRGILLVCLWVTVWMVWLSLRPLLTAVRWSWSSHNQSMNALQQARDYQAQLRQSLQDLTSVNAQLNRLNKLAQSLRQEAEEERQVKEEFVANVSHELRTPINMIIGFCSMILDSPDAYGDQIPSKLLADLQVVLRNSQHLSSLIDDVLDLSQINAGRMAITKERVSFQEIVDAAITAVQPLFQSKKLSLKVDVEPGLPPIWCDRTRIREVLLNLLSNAGRFTEEGGVAVHAMRENNFLKVGVQDSGPGISENDQQKLFKPFQQADNSIRRRYGGTGLGLNISKRFVELHDGQMWMESILGEGTTIYFQIPIDPIIEPVANPARWISAYRPHEERVRPLRMDLPDPSLG